MYPRIDILRISEILVDTNGYRYFAMDKILFSKILLHVYGLVSTAESNISNNTSNRV